MIKISLEKVFPKYFIPKNPEQSEIWNKEVLIQKGEKVLIVSPSGSGKSTLATAILGTHTEYDGNICYDQSSIKTFNLEEIVKSRVNGINLLFQDVRLIKNLTLYDNIMLRIFHQNKSKYEEKLNLYSSRLGIQHLLHKKAANCSYGERQRVAIVRSLINPTSFLLYDECFSHLDKQNKQIAFELIDSVAEEAGCAVIFFELNRFPFEHNYKILHL